MSYIFPFVLFRFTRYLIYFNCFRRLEKTFGIAPSALSRAGASSLPGAGANIFPTEFGSSNSNGKSSMGFLFAQAEETLPRSASDPSDMRAAAAGTNAATSAALAAKKQENGKGKVSISKGFDPLPIQSMTQDRLQASLTDSKVIRSL